MSIHRYECPECQCATESRFSKPHACPVCVGEKLVSERDEALRSAQAWEESAAFHLRNEQFWRGLVMQIGEPFGAEAKTSDDGSVQEDVLGLKVPELVEKIRKENARLRAAFRRMRDHIKEMDARITMARVEIREKQAAVGQLEKEKWDLDREIGKIEESLAE